MVKITFDPVARCFSASGESGIIEISTNAVKYLGGAHVTRRFDFRDFKSGAFYTDAGKALHGGEMDLEFFKSEVVPKVEAAINVLVDYGVDRKDIKCIATALLREAANADECIKMVKDATGLYVRVLPPEKEAVGAVSAFLKTTRRDLRGKYVVSMDMGGGSTELAVVLDGKLLWKRSFAVGQSLGRRESIAIPDSVFKDEDREKVLVGTGYALKKALGIGSNAGIHDKEFPVEKVKSGLSKEPMAKVFVEMAKKLGVGTIIGNGTGNIFSELLYKKLN